MAALSPQEFEALVRRELAERDNRRRARLGDPRVYAEADTSAVAAIMAAAGYDRSGRPGMPRGGVGELPQRTSPQPAGTIAP